MQLQLREYPSAIERTQTQLLKVNQQVRKFRQILQSLDREIDMVIAMDSNLKNDTQRKSYRAEMQAQEEYQGALLDLHQAQDKQAELEIALEHLRGEFSVLKLEMRQMIAQLELAA